MHASDIAIGVPQGADHPTRLPYRADIDGLRAVAVLSVVGYHAFSLSSGFIGVDIFFVISGFLISSVILESLRRNTFSLTAFYLRRVRRIFPALLLVLFASYAFGWLVLLPDEYRQLGKHIAGSAGFVANLVLWNETGYFDARAAATPLRHLWSLGIEEQYYIVWPSLVWLAWKWRVNALGLSIAIALISFALNIGHVYVDPNAAFYSPQTRLWELLIGSALACLAFHNQYSRIDRNTRLATLRSFAGAGLIAIGLLTITEERAFPGWWALLPTAGAALIISAGEQAGLNRSVLSHRLLVWFGLISYPLYLWHWPLLSFAHIVEIDRPSRAIRVAAVFVSVVLAWLTYELVEKPLRSGQLKMTMALSLLVPMIIVGCLGYRGFEADGPSITAIAKSTSELSRATHDWSYPNPDLDGKGSGDRNQFSGMSSERVLFMGDSTMAQYYPRVVRIYSDDRRRPYLSASVAAQLGCRPMPHLDGKGQHDHQCAAQYRAVMNGAKDPVYKKIVIAADWPWMFGDSDISANMLGLVGDLTGLTRSGKLIILISQHPHGSGMDPHALARPFRLHPFDDSIRIPYEQWTTRSSLEAQDGWASIRLAALANKVGATVINPFDYLCTTARCPAVLDGKPLYTDGYHLRASAAREYATFIDGIVNQ